MNNITCAIIDDEPLAIRLLANFVSKTPGLKLRFSSTDPIAALDRLKQEPTDLLFLDIQMPDLSGMELSRMVPPATRVIFTTAFKQYAFDSYEVNALDFLLKPIRYGKFLAAVEKARQWFDLKARAEAATTGPADEASATSATASLSASSAATVPAEPVASSVFVRVDGELRRLDVSAILYVEGMKDYVVFHLLQQQRPVKVVSHMTMKAAEEMLPARLFMRVHRSFIVAVDRIERVDRNNCVYLAGEVIRVTDAYLPAFQRYLAAHQK